MNDVLCAAFAGFSVAVPGAYGMNNAFHGYVPRVFVCAGDTVLGGKRVLGYRIFADANCASGPLVTRST